MGRHGALLLSWGGGTTSVMGWGRFVSRRSDLAVVEYGFGNGRAHPHYLGRVWAAACSFDSCLAHAHEAAHILSGGVSLACVRHSRRWVRCGRNTERASSTSCIGSRG